MVARSRAGQEKQPRTHLAGTLPATIPSAALIVTVLLVAGCGRTTTPTSTSRPQATATPTSTWGPQATATPTVIPTSAILPGAPLSWTVGKLLPVCPCAFGPIYGNNSAGGVNDPADGNTAYTVEPAASSSGRLALWVTHDRAQHWTQLAPIPSIGRQITVCMIIPDAADPSMVVVDVSWVPVHEFTGPPTDTFAPDFTQFVTLDGGAQWQPLPGLEPILLWLATYHGTTLALLDNSSGIHLWSSTDHLQTWHELPEGPFGRNLLTTPWINPATGDLIVLDEIGTAGQGYIDESTDLGQHWTSLPTPSALSGVLFVVSPPVAGQPWRLCGVGGDVSVSPFNAGMLMCSMDSGRTWTSRPQLITTFDNSAKGLVVPEAEQLVALGADGTIYAVMEGGLPMGIPAGLYQLTPQATRWQSLTLPPGDAVAVPTGLPDTVDTTDIPGSGILWTVPGGLSGLYQGWAGPFPAASV